MRPISKLLFLPLLASGSVQAGPLIWTIEGQFAPSDVSPPYFISGTFTYDASLNQVLDYSVGFGPFPGRFEPGCEFVIGIPGCTVDGSGGVTPDGSVISFSNAYYNGHDHESLTFYLTAPLTDAGGHIGVVPGSCVICFGPGFGGTGSGDRYQIFLANGYFIPVAHATIWAAPEPAPGSLAAFALLAMLAFRLVKERKRLPRA